MSGWAFLIAGALATEAPGITLLTIEPGAHPMSRAGHAALCVIHPRQKLEMQTCYNYGITDTSKPARLTATYFRGNATFWVAKVRWAQTLQSNGERQDRTIWRQDIAFAEADAIALAEKLASDALPANRNYRYHHFEANCTSRLRDYLDVAGHGALGAGADQPYGPSWRAVARERLAGEPLLLFGVEIAGRPADTIPTLWQAMVRPEVLRHEVEQRLGAVPTRIHERRGAPLGVGRTDLGALELLALGLFGGGIAAGGAIVGPRAARAGQIATSVALGVAGLLCLALFIGSNLPEIRQNELHAIFVPSDLAIPWLPARWRTGYLGVRLAGLVVMLGLAGVGVLVQPVWPTLAALFALGGIAATTLAVPARSDPAGLVLDKPSY